MKEHEDMIEWYKYRLDDYREQLDDQMRFIFKVHNYARETEDEKLNQMCVEYYLMRMEKDM
jgi:hypothetical protein